MKKLRWSDLSLVSKIVIEVGVLAALMFTINMLFYVRINNSMQEMDDVYIRQQCPDHRTGAGF